MFAVMLFGLTACNLGSAPAAGGVAVVDLNRVGKALGRLELINQRVEQYTRQQQAALIKLRDQLRVHVAGLKKSLGSKPNKQQLQEFQQRSQAAEDQLTRAKTKVNQQIAQYKVNQVAEFRNEARPVARRLATAKGLSVVLLQRDNLLWVDDTVDITSGVIAEMSRR